MTDSQNKKNGGMRIEAPSSFPSNHAIVPTSQISQVFNESNLFIEENDSDDKAKEITDEPSQCNELEDAMSRF